MTLIERLVPLLRSIVDILEPASLHIGLTTRDLCISFLPKRAVGPTRLCNVIQKIGLKDSFFIGEGGSIKGATILSSGSQGAFQIHTKAKAKRKQTKAKLIRRGKFRPMLWIVVDRHDIPIGAWRVLPYVVDLPVYLNGQLLDTKYVSHNSGLGQRKKRFKQAWRTKSHRGFVYYNPNQEYTTILHGERIVTLSAFAASMFVLVTDGPALEDYSLLLKEISCDMRSSAAVNKETLKKWGSDQVIDLENFKTQITGNKISALLDEDYKSLRMMALMLGMGIKEQLTDLNMGYRNSASTEIAGLLTTPVILDGYNRLSCTLIPDDIPIVAEYNAPPYVPRHKPSVIGLNVTSLDVDDLVNVWFVDSLHVGDYQIPYLFVDSGGSIETETGEVIICDNPSFLITKGELSIWEIWRELYKKELLLETILYILTNHNGELTHEYFDTALAGTWIALDGYIDYPLLAMLLLQLVFNKTAEERAYTIQGGISLGLTSHYPVPEDDEESPDFQRPHSEETTQERNEVIERFSGPAQEDTELDSKQ